MRIAVGSDHRGYTLKQSIVPMLEEMGHQYQDMGCHNGESVDYPDVAVEVAWAVADGKADFGLLICGTGIGMSVAANKVPGVRAAVCWDTVSARMARQHNNANILCMGGDLISEPLARVITAAYLTSQFEGGRHARRIEKIGLLEKNSQAPSPRLPE